jgi:cobalt/nickel transport system permease protein
VRQALLEPYQPRRSAIHRLPAGVKAGAALAFVLAVVLLPRASWAAYAGAAVLLLLLAALSRLPAAALARRLLLLEPFALGVAVLSLLQPDGLRVFAATLARSTLCLFCMVLLTGTTRFSAILRVLWRIRVPSLLVTTLALMHRYLFLLAQEAGRMQRARRSRSYVDGRASAWRSSASVVAQLFVRSSERAERIYSAMCARGWKT